ncbi:hypothetical protein [Paenibacillus taichungensis]|uniref:hypothetical protein n=1 Tax=Paenibacillus taichungensis TaxID=484184 RepID=UPI0039A5DEB3
MSIGWIVGSSLATVVLLTGIISLISSMRKNNNRRWPWWFIGFGVAALVSAAINYPGT